MIQIAVLLVVPVGFADTHVAVPAIPYIERERSRRQ